MQILIGWSEAICIKIAVQALTKHVMLIDPTGVGKSTSLMWKLCQLITQFGLFMPDLDGRSARWLFSLILTTKVKGVRERTIFWKEGMPLSSLPCPFKSPPGQTKTERVRFGGRIAEFVGNTMSISMEDQAQQIRRGRVLKAVMELLMLIGIENWREAVDFDAKWYLDVLAKHETQLTSSTVSELKRLKGLNQSARHRETESTINFLSRFDDETILEWLRVAPPFDADEARRNRSIIILDLEELGRIHGPVVSQGFAMAFSQTSAKVPFFLVFEEVTLHLSAGLVQFLERGRGRGLSCLLTTQSLAGFKNKNTDIREQVLANCYLLESFQSKEPATSRVIAETMIVGSIPYMMKRRENMIPTNEFETTIIPEVSRRVGRRVAKGKSGGMTLSTGENREESQRVGSGEDISSDVSAGQTKKSGVVLTNNNQFTTANQEEFWGNERRLTHTGASGYSSATQEGEDQSFTQRNGKTLKTSQDHGSKRGRQNSHSLQDGWKYEVSNDNAITTTDKVVRERIYKKRIDDEGLKLSPDVFVWIMRTVLFRQGVGECVMQCGNQPPIKVKVPELKDPSEERPRWVALNKKLYLDNLIPQKPEKETRTSEISSSSIPAQQTSGTEQSSTGSQARKLLATLQEYSHKERQSQPDTSAE